MVDGEVLVERLRAHARGRAPRSSPPRELLLPSWRRRRVDDASEASLGPGKPRIQTSRPVNSRIIVSSPRPRVLNDHGRAILSCRNEIDGSLGPSSRPTSTRASPSRRCGWRAGASACRRRPSGTSWPGSRSWGTSSSRTPRPAASRPTSATGATSIRCLSERRTPRADAAGRSAAAPRRQRRRPADARVAGALARVAPGRLRDRARRGRDDARAPRLRAARRRPGARRRRWHRRPRLAQGDRAERRVRSRRSCSRPPTI